MVPLIGFIGLVVYYYLFKKYVYLLVIVKNVSLYL